MNKLCSLVLIAFSSSPASLHCRLLSLGGRSMALVMLPDVRNLCMHPRYARWLGPEI